MTPFISEILPSFSPAKADGVQIIDYGLCRDNVVRVFLSNASIEQIITPEQSEILELDESLIIETHKAAQPYRFSLKNGEEITLDVQPFDTTRFQDKRCLLITRMRETPTQLANVINYHRIHHGAEAALIIDRAPDPLESFSQTLHSLLNSSSHPIDLLVTALALPSGHPDVGPETHAYLAPDAPRKDRMTPPAPDPWRAPLRESTLYEVMRWRWLSTAKSVISLEACDLVPRPPNTPSVFETVELHGAISLQGRALYPWRLRTGKPVEFGDHICVLFDSKRQFNRWGCVPRRLSSRNVWRQTRITYLAPHKIVPFWRAMALRHSDSADLPLAPKSGLILNDDAYALSKDLGAKPILPTKEDKKGSKSASKPTTSQRVTIITTMKNEGPFILEWLAYHRAIGVSDFLIYTNDCTDGTDKLLKILMQKGLCQWRENPFKGTDLKPQHAALQAAEHEAVVKECDWGICMDVDEYINIKIGDGTLPSLFENMERVLPGANMIALTWRLFGNSETHSFQDELITAQFTRAAPELSRKPHQAWGFKTLFRNIKIFKKLGVHRPKGLKPELWSDIRWLNGSGKELPKTMFRNSWRSTSSTYGYDWVQLNHYAVRSAESFLVKRDRGRVNHVDRDQGLNYWFRMNHNHVEERSIQRLLPKLRQEYQRILDDPEIKAAHDYCIKQHKEKIAQLLETSEYSKFYRTLTSDRMQQICRLQHHFGSAVFNAGPDSIPDTLDLSAVPSDFFFTVEYSGEQKH